MKKLHTIPIKSVNPHVMLMDWKTFWRGREQITLDFLLSMVGGMAGFAYLRFKRADPPCMCIEVHGMRLWQADVLNALGNKYNVVNWTEASILFRRSGKKIMQLCEAALKQDK